jgi:hypothetical protein
MDRCNISIVAPSGVNRRTANFTTTAQIQDIIYDCVKYVHQSRATTVTVTTSKRGSVYIQINGSTCATIFETIHKTEVRMRATLTQTRQKNCVGTLQEYRTNTNEPRTNPQKPKKKRVKFDDTVSICSFDTNLPPAWATLGSFEKCSWTDSQEGTQMYSDDRPQEYVV